MSNVWTSMAFRAPCAARQTRSQPLLHLFNGYSRTTSCVKQTALSSAKQWRVKAGLNGDLQSTGRAFSTSSYAGARKRNLRATPSNAPKAANPANESRLEPAPTVVAYTEGLAGTTGEEELTWRDYDPAGGMPIPAGERSQADINEIFDAEDVDVDTGNYILSVMHWRRMSGALIDTGLDFPRESGVSRAQALRGLLYVRSLIPDVDEAALGALWAEEESKKAAKEIQDRAVKLGIYKPLPEEEASGEEQEYIEEAEEEKQGTEYGREKSGRSVFQTVREANEARAKREQAEKVAAELREETAAIHRTRGPLELGAGVQPTANHLVVARDDQGVAIHQPTKKAWLQPYERKAWVKQYEEDAQILKTEKAPELSTSRRLVPPFLFLLAILAGCFYLHENYTPPPKSARLMPDSPPSAATLWALTGVLVAGFVLNRVPPLWRTYSKYLTIVPAYPWAVSILGAGFRHDTLRHLVVNLVPLWLFGLLLHEDVGRGTFLAIYLASGTVGGYASLATNVLRKNWASYIFGSSGAVFGVVAASCLLRPNGTVKVAGYEVPISAWVFLAFAATAEVVSARFMPMKGVDHPGHLGGIAAGAAMAMYLRMKAREREELKQDVKIEDGEEIVGS
ncbi:unnamed protein product [Zymoseptoria tritici ST99CH_1E4]|nr:unnamed protein product [Zymoseptoria tritici ST99CH_1E4]